MGCAYLAIFVFGGFIPCAIFVDVHGIDGVLSVAIIIAIIFTISLAIYWKEIKEEWSDE